MIVDPRALRQNKFWIINENENVGSITLGLVKINVHVKNYIDIMFMPEWVSVKNKKNI